jgi:hypothetical protein
MPLRARRATRVPHWTGKPGIQRTPPVSVTPPISWRSPCWQDERIPRMCLIRVRSQVLGRHDSHPEPGPHCTRWGRSSR